MVDLFSLAAAEEAQGRRRQMLCTAELPQTGERFEGEMPPVAPAPCFAVRQPADIFYRLGDYVAARIMSVRQAEVLALAVAERKNILVVGGTSSGKTTLVNVLLAEIADLNERVVILEDTRELKCAAADCVSLRTKPGVATLADLVRSTLQLRPGSIITGANECGPTNTERSTCGPDQSAVR
jgi:type IV secretion system protein VirB11